MNELTPYTLRQLIVYFLKLGTIGFGGPVVHGCFFQTG